MTTTQQTDALWVEMRAARSRLGDVIEEGSRANTLREQALAITQGDIAAAWLASCLRQLRTLTSAPETVRLPVTSPSCSGDTGGALPHGGA